MKNDSSTDLISLYVYISEQKLRDEILSALPADCYAVSVFAELDSLLKGNQHAEPELVLVHQSSIPDNLPSQVTSLRQRFANSRILVIGPSIPISMQISALKHGARGYFTEELPLHKVNDALQLILHGEVWVERQVVTGLIDELTHAAEISNEQNLALQSLSPKEMEVAKLVSHGATNKMIAKAMDITERTVKAHLTAIFHKMNLTDRLSLAIFFRDLR